MALTEEEKTALKNEITQGVLEQIKSNSTDIATATEVTSKEEFESFVVFSKDGATLSKYKGSEIFGQAEDITEKFKSFYDQENQGGVYFEDKGGIETDITQNKKNINTLQSKVSTVESSYNNLSINYETLRTSLDNETTRATGAEESLASRIDVLEGTGEGSVKKQIAEGIAEVVNNAPEDFDTLKEIADYIASDKTGATEISNKISKNTSDISGLKEVSERLKNDIDTEITRAQNVEKNLQNSSVDVNSFEVETLEGGLGIKFNSTSGEVGNSIEIPTATIDYPGVMSADDKIKLENNSAEVEKLIERVNSIEDFEARIATLEARIAALEELHAAIEATVTDNNLTLSGDGVEVADNNLTLPEDKVTLEDNNLTIN